MTFEFDDQKVTPDSDKKTAIMILSVLGSIAFLFLLAAINVASLSKENRVLKQALHATAENMDSDIRFWQEKAKQESTRKLSPGAIKVLQASYSRNENIVSPRSMSDIDKAIAAGINSLPRIEARWGALIDYTVGTFGLDALAEDSLAYLVRSVMAIESGGNPQAVSDSGALGLIQMLLETASDYDQAVTTRKLFRPENNILYGALYLRRSHYLFNGDEKKMIVSYWAGNHDERGVRWAEREFGSLDKVPYYRKVSGVLRFLRENDEKLFSVRDNLVAMQSLTETKMAVAFKAELENPVKAVSLESLNDQSPDKLIKTVLVSGPALSDSSEIDFGRAFSE